MSGRSWFAIVLLLAPLAVCAQEEPVRSIRFKDPEVFCHILHNSKNQRLAPLGSIEEMAQNPAETMLIIFGEAQNDNVTQALNEVREFQANGGAVLIATGTPLHHPRLPIHISGWKVRRSQGFEDEVLCPWLALPTEENPDESGDRKHPIFHLVFKGIATNWPSRVKLDDAKAPVRTLLSFPPEAKWDVQAKWGTEHYIIGSPRDALPGGRALYIAGHGVFMNGMLLQAKTDNFRFALNVVDWLAEAPDGKRRTKALLIVDGTIVPDFDMKLTPPPPPIPMPPRAIINRLLRDLQEEGRIHQMFYANIDIDSAVAYVLSFLVGGLLVYGAKKSLEGRQQVDPAAPRMVGKIAPPTPTAGASQTQQIATLEHANLRREARELVHAWFQQEFGVEPEFWSESATIQLRVQRYFWSLGATHGQADLVLRMARVAKSVKVSRHGLVQVASALQDLTIALRAGRVTLLIDGKTVRKSA